MSVQCPCCYNIYVKYVKESGTYVCDFCGNEFGFERAPIVETDNVNHPSHYVQGKIEVIDFIEAWDLNFSRGNAIKYICRAKYKGNELEDLKKARFYLDREIKRAENERNTDEGA